ncbi:uncharacterized protein LOC128985069 [Macrosteles quadrilineatus]|uniref:uncharacterized protein LOC128985069 n=1 Tax=Macrosteles quadrilineatus TaxID=74068 RepID=UPI0023E2A8D4|nr:uncharacterized protein LOC128985069 [Macrosteles quadrilineatus]
MAQDLFVFSKSFQERLDEYNCILTSNLKAEDVKREWSIFLESHIEPAGWRAIWKMSQNYPRSLLVTIDLINFKELTCTVQINEVEDGVDCVPLKVSDIPLIELYPTIGQNNNKVFVKLFNTAKAIDSLRFFYNHLWMPWDENYGGSDSWVTSHLEGRLYLQFELMERKVPNQVAYNVCKLISKGRNVLREIEDVQLKLTELLNEMAHLQNQFSVFEKPVLLKSSSGYYMGKGKEDNEGLLANPSLPFTKIVSEQSPLPEAISFHAMGKALDIEHFPLEVLEALVSFLSAKDLSNCIGVSKTWYSIFSDDLFWKRHCIASSNSYFSKNKCLVDPAFKLTTNNTVLPIEKNRLSFLQEQHLLNNWRCGRFRKEVIGSLTRDKRIVEYDFQLSFLDDDHIFENHHVYNKGLTYETRVWNVAETLVLVLTIPHCLSERFEADTYQIVNSNLIVVIQCNLVQVYKISLDSKNCVLNHLFFFDKPEEFSHSLTADSDIESIVVSSISDFPDVQYLYRFVFSGQYMIGTYAHGESALLHIWDVKTGKKVKEDRYEIGPIEFTTLKSTQQVTDKVLVTYHLKHVTNIGNDVGVCSSIIYDISRLQFILPSRFVHNGWVSYFDGHLSVIKTHSEPLKIVYHHDAMNQSKTMTGIETCPTTNVHPLGSNLLISTEHQIYLVNPVNLVTCNLMRADFRLFHTEVLAGRFILLYGWKDACYACFQEVWEICETECRKVWEYPKTECCITMKSNSVCSKVLLRRKKSSKLIVLNFW